MDGKLFLLFIFILIFYYSHKSIEKSPRYICVTCRPGACESGNGYIDFCYTCFDNIRKANEQGKEIMRKDQDNFENITTDLGFKCKVSAKHLQDHVYLCLICSCSGFDYYQF